MNICVYGASSVKTSEKYISETEILGKKLAAGGHGLVFGGGANGLMGAVARGFTMGNGKIIGIAPHFFNVDGLLYDKCSEFIYPDTMRERKKIMEDLSDAFIMTPGGIGTFDEFFEILTLKQLARHTKPIAVFNIDGYFDELDIMMKKAVKENLLTEKSLSLYGVFTDSDSLIEYIENSNDEAAKIEETKFVE